ncbi:EAL domain-containing protein [Terasakiella sp. A23]|uniref:sensor domain-containing protein n=1 Tax=Terasakiella sp. FCG-A23 TaxID=3080561 RepID=UPI0029559CC1|nr:EAL domain-containing protein [Terasakiella sp. A23]MDV7340093.1 EAL domain-containing protein [Terasakiella sp. A23]
MATQTTSLTRKRKSARLRALVVLVLGVIVTIAVSLFVKNLQEGRRVATQQSLANDYIHALERELDRKSRLFAPLAHQVSIAKEHVSRDDVLKRLKELNHIISQVPEQQGIRFMSLVPTWAVSDASLRDQIVARFEAEKVYVKDFLSRQQELGGSQKSVPVLDESLIMGWDQLGTTERRFMVIAHPFFRTFDKQNHTSSDRRYAVGHVMVWLDLPRTLRQSWDGFRDPERLIYLEINATQTEPIYAIYQSGLIEISDVRPDVFIEEETTAIQFNMLGQAVSFRFENVVQQDANLFTHFHWVVLIVGLFSTVLWSLMAVRISDQQKDAKSNIASLDDVSQKLAHEAHQRRTVEDVLAMNQARWNFVVDNLPVVLFAVDRTGMFTLGEGKGLTALGLQPGKVEGSSIFEVFEDQPHLIDIMRECLSGETRHELVHLGRYWLDMRFSPVVSGDGSFEGLICVATDVTGEQNVRKRLDKVNMHLRGLMDNVPTGVAFVKGGIIQWCSRRLEEIFGYDHDALKGRSPEILYDDVETFRNMENMARMELMERNSFDMKVTFRRADKTRFKGEMTGRLVDRFNTKSGTMWVVQDLTRFIEEEKERRLTQTVFDNVVEGVMVTDASGKVILVNKAFVSITGYQEADVLGRDPSVLRSDKHDAEFFETMWAHLDKSGEWEGEIWNRRKNGQIYLCWQNISALKDDKGNVEEYVAVFNDITSQRETQEQLTYQSNYDLLTGLPNRQLLADRFTQATAQAQREHKAFSLVYMDLDNFKYLNESLGLEAGDQIIKTVAARLDQSLRSVDTVARIGGDEFIIMLIGAGDEEAASRAIANLSMVISQPIKISQHEDDILMSASCGVAMFPRDGETLEELSPKAEAAMHSAKEVERGLFMFFTDDMNERAQERLQLETKLRRALVNDEFQLYYQPKVSVETGEIFGAEALIRWMNPELGMIGPDKFIPIAEETGLIVSIGEWVFETACKQLKKWKDAGLPLHNVAVNLSGRQFTKPDLAHDLIAIIHESGIDPSALEIEITESFIATSETGVVDALNLLSNTGVQLSVDDFGTGYSSLNYLHRFPLDIMKIDRSFIMRIGEEDEGVTGNLAKAVIAIAKSMDLKIVGEGVENETQLGFLKENGCDLIQGYYFSRPLPVDEFETLLRSGRTL